MLENLSVQRFPSTPEVSIAYKVVTTGAPKPPLLLLHGHPQTHMIWHKMVARLSQRYTLVLPDLRGYGRSSKPQGEPDHSNYSKRVMAQDIVALMASLGYSQFAVCAHDRGARVAHRMALDHPAAISQLMLLDIAPTLAMYEQTNLEFAKAYWHWFFLIQPGVLPERTLSLAPEDYMQAVMGGRHAGMTPFSPAALQDYLAALKLPGTAHAICEDYRAAASIDLEHDAQSRASGQKIGCELQVLWGKLGVIEQCFKPLDEWARVAKSVSGYTLDCGHYMPEEAPDALGDAIFDFFTY
jgi:haloacetate dehalogenase